MMVTRIIDADDLQAKKIYELLGWPGHMSDAVTAIKLVVAQPNHELLTVMDAAGEIVGVATLRHLRSLQEGLVTSVVDVSIEGDGEVALKIFSELVSASFESATDAGAAELTIDSSHIWVNKTLIELNFIVKNRNRYTFGMPSAA